MNNDGSYGKVYRVTLVDGKAEVSTLPSMPCSVDNMAGALVGKTSLYSRRSNGW